MKKHYPAIIEKSKSGFSIFFPDLNGCTSRGDILDQALDNAHIALKFHVEGIFEDNDELPEPSNIKDLEIDSNVEIHLVTTIPVTYQT